MTEHVAAKEYMTIILNAYPFFDSSARSQPVIDSRGDLCTLHMQDAKRLTGVQKWGAAPPHKSPMLQNADNEVTERMKPYKVKH